MFSNLELIARCDKFPYRHKEPVRYSEYVDSLYKFHVEGCSVPLGFVLPSTVNKINWPDFWTVDHALKTLTLAGDTVEKRDAHMAQTLLAEKDRGTFKVLQGWRGELFPVYGPEKQILMSIERAGSALFGIMIYGVHMSAYEVSVNGALKYWVAKRSCTKQTYPGMLDNTVGGGITTGELPLESIVREATGEAALPEETVRKGAKSVGVVTYFDIRDEHAGGETGLLQPECIFVYDLRLEPGVVLKPDDHEAESFKLMDIQQLTDGLASGQFKTNCALVIIDFLIRHGIITAETEKDYIEILARLHRNPEFYSA